MRSARRKKKLVVMIRGRNEKGHESKQTELEVSSIEISFHQCSFFFVNSKIYPPIPEPKLTSIQPH